MIVEYHAWICIYSIIDTSFAEGRANGLELYVGKTQDTMVQISSIETFTEILKTIYPPAGTEARYVLLELRTYMPIHLAEVEVQGEPAEGSICVVVFFLYRWKNFLLHLTVTCKHRLPRGDVQYSIWFFFSNHLSIRVGKSINVFSEIEDTSENVAKC